MATTTQTTEFNPAAHGLRVADEPIRRKPRSPNSRATPKPQYADAVWYSFQHGTPLEISVRVPAAADTVRKLKRAARYLERVHSAQGKKVEVRVQISVEADPDPGKPNHSLVKFLGHEPWLLGRRISMEKGHLGATEAYKLADLPPEGGQHRKRSVSGVRGTHRKTALRPVRRPVVRAVITPHTPQFARSFTDPGERGGCGVFPFVNPRIRGCPGACVTVASL